MKRDFLKGLNDELLVKYYIEGNNEAFGIIYERYISKIYYKCFSFVKNTDEALDLSHEILLKAFSKIHYFKFESKFSTWIYAISQNYCIGNFRKSKKLVYDNLSIAYNIAEDSDEIEEIVNHELEIEELSKYVQYLDKDERDLLILKYYNNYSIQKIQEIYGASASAVKMRLLRARKKLGKIIESNTSISKAS